MIFGTEDARDRLPSLYGRRKSETQYRSYLNQIFATEVHTLYERHTTPRALCSRSRLQADSRNSDRSGQSLYFGYARCVVIWLDETLEPHRCGFRSRLGQSRRVDRIRRELESTSRPSDARQRRHGPRFRARQRTPTWRRRSSGGNRFSSRLCDGGRKEGRRQSVAYRICLCVRSDVAYWRCGGKLSRTERLPRAWIDGYLRRCSGGGPAPGTKREKNGERSWNCRLVLRRTDRIFALPRRSDDQAASLRQGRRRRSDGRAAGEPRLRRTGKHS